VFAGGDPGAYPSGNSFPTPDQFEAQFVSYVGGDYRLTGASPWHRAGSDGQDLGVVFGGDVAAPAPAPAGNTGTAPSGGIPHRQPIVAPPQ